MAETEGTLTALDVLRRDGWCKGTLLNHSGSRCTLGAVRAVANVAANEQSPLEAMLADVVGEQFPDRAAWQKPVTGHGMVASFNDHPDTTFADVELVLEKAQLRLDEVTADV